MLLSKWTRAARGVLPSIFAPTSIGLSLTTLAAGMLAAQSPDLVPTSVTGPASAQIGQTIQATVAYANQGSVTSTATWQGRIYLSTDQTITMTDTHVDSWTRNTDLTPGASGSYVGTFPVPSVAPGTYFLGTIVDVNDAETESDETNNSLAASASITITAVPTIGLSSATLTYAATVGTDPPTQTVTVTNAGGGTLNWSATVDQTWFSASPASGSLAAGASEDITVTVTSAGLTAGTYAGTLTVGDPAASNTPQTVAIDLTVAAAPAIGLSPATLTFASEVGTNPSTQTVTVTNTGGGTLDWSASVDQTWLSVSPSSGSLGGAASQILTVTVTSAGLAPGSYSATLTVSDPAAGNSPQSATVDLTVTATPAIGVSPATLTYAATAGTDPPIQTVTVTNTGNGTLNWTTTVDQTWLDVAPSSGSLAAGTSQILTVTVTSSGLGAGSYLGNVTVGDPAASNTPQTVAVDLTVTPPPAIGVTPSSLSFGTPVGASPPPQTITITNTGGGTLDWDAVVDQSWLSVSPTSGSLTAGASQTVTVTVTSTSLPGGSYAGTITIADAGASNSPQTVAVSLTVSAAPAIGVSPNLLTYAAQIGSNPPSQTVTVTNTGTGTLDWSATVDQSWLGVSPVSGSLTTGGSQILTVTATSVGLAIGSYAGTVTITDPAASNSPQVVTVDLIVSAFPAIGVSPGSLSFGAAVGVDPPNQIVTVTNTGGGTLAWSAAVNQSWLGVSPSTGSLTSGQSQSVTVRVLSASLAAGNYAGTITISDAGASNSPQMVVVNLAVSSSPAIGVTPGALSFAADEGADPANQSLTVANVGGGTLNWGAAADQTWLSLGPNTGTRGAGQSQTVTVTVSSSSLAPGSYAGIITITDPAASNSPQTVPVTLAVSAAVRQPTIAEAANSLLGPNALTPDIVAFLDSIGNQNGRYDVGDFRAYVQMLGLTASAIEGGP